MPGIHNPKLDKKTILLMGTGRSGTTWLAGLLAAPFRYRLLFEPFQPHQVEGAELVADRYFDPGNIPASVRRFVQRALNDQIDSQWIAQSSSRRFRMHRWRFWPRARIAKIIRGNLLIPALRAMYGPDLPVVVLMRHPGAVVESFLRVGFPWAFDIQALTQQSLFHEQYRIPIERLSALANDRVGKLAVRWIIENAYLLQNADQFGVHIVLYEDLLDDPAARIRELCALFKLETARNLDEIVKRSSYTTHPRSPLHSSTGAASGWRERLGVDEVEKLLKILDIAGVGYPR